MEKIITLDRLNRKGVSVIFENINENGVVLRKIRSAYANSESGRQRMDKEVPEPYRTAIFAVWGDTPTVTEDEQ